MANYKHLLSAHFLNGQDQLDLVAIKVCWFFERRAVTISADGLMVLESLLRPLAPPFKNLVGNLEKFLEGSSGQSLLNCLMSLLAWNWSNVGSRIWNKGTAFHMDKAEIQSHRHLYASCSFVYFRAGHNLWVDITEEKISLKIREKRWIFKQRFVNASHSY